MQALYCSFFTFISLLILVGCTRKEEPPQSVSDSDAYFSIPIDNTPLKLQLALTRSEQAKGLMYRDFLPKDHGMLFLFKYPGPPCLLDAQYPNST